MRFYKSTSSSIQFLVVFLSRYVLNQFQLRVCNVYPTNFSENVFCGDLGGGRSPPLGYATDNIICCIHCNTIFFTFEYLCDTLHKAVVIPHLNGTLFGVYTRLRILAHSISPVCLSNRKGA